MIATMLQNERWNEEENENRAHILYLKVPTTDDNDNHANEWTG